MIIKTQESGQVLDRIVVLFQSESVLCTTLLIVTSIMTYVGGVWKNP